MDEKKTLDADSGLVHLHRNDDVHFQVPLK